MIVFTHFTFINSFKVSNYMYLQILTRSRASDFRPIDSLKRCSDATNIDGLALRHEKQWVAQRVGHLADCSRHLQGFLVQLQLLPLAQWMRSASAMNVSSPLLVRV